LTGVGGIIGSLFAGSDLGDFNIGGFIITSVFATVGNGVKGNFTVGGLGIRDSLFTGGSSTGNVIATGRGEHLDLLDFGSSVRLSENYDYDPYFGVVPNELTDLHSYLGTSVIRHTNIAGVTNSGMMDNVVLKGARNLGKVEA